MGELIDVDKAGIVAALFDEVWQLEGFTVGKVDAAAGDADVVGQHGKCVDKPDGKAALQMALEAKTGPDMHGMVGGDELHEKIDGFIGLINSGQ